MPASELTQAKLTEMVRQATSDGQAEVTRQNVELAVAKGENYSGEVCRVDMDVKRGNGQTETMNWVVKTIAETPFFPKPMIRGMHMEDKEIAIYRTMIPAWKKMVADKGADIELNFCDCHYTEFNDEGSLIAMQDMRTLGFRDAINKKKGLSPPHVKLALAELAKYHACGYAWLKSHSGGLKGGLEEHKVIARDYMRADPEEEVAKFFDSFTTGAAEESFFKPLQMVQEPGQDMESAFRRYHKEHSLHDVPKKIATVDHNGFNTMTHGDSWFNNMLFRYGKEGNPNKCVLIDLAVGSYNNPMIDLTYFLFLSTTPMLRRTHEQEFLGYYHDQLVSNLHKLGEDPSIYPYRQMMKDYNARLMHGFLSCLQILPAVICKREDAMGSEDFNMGEAKTEEEMEELMKKADDIYKKMYDNEPQIKIVISGSFLELVDKGVVPM